MTSSIFDALTGLKASDWAAWAQAVGSVVAIVVAFIVGRQQANASLAAVSRAYAMQLSGRQKSILAIAEAALDRIKEFGEAVMAHESNPAALYNIYDKSVIDGMVGALTNVPAHEIGSRDGVLALLSLRDQIRFLGDTVETFRSPKLDVDSENSLSGLDPPERAKQRRRVKEIQAKNVQSRVKKIEEDYALLQAAMAGISAAPVIGAKQNKGFRWDLTALAVSVIASAFTGLQWWEAHTQNKLASDAQIGFEIDTDPADDKLGIGVRNVGPGVAKIRSVQYFVDGKRVKAIDDVIDGANLSADRLHPIELIDEPMGPGEIIWIVRYNARKAELDRATEFFENHLNAAVDYCTLGGKCVTVCSETDGCGKHK